MSLWIAVTYIISTIIIALVSPFYGLVLLIGSILIRFQDRFEVLNSQPTYVYMCLACIVGFIIHKDKDDLGLGRIKCSTFIDEFAGHDKADVTDNEYTASIDIRNNELRPGYTQENVGINSVHTNSDSLSLLTNGKRT